MSAYLRACVWQKGGPCSKVLTLAHASNKSFDRKPIIFSCKLIHWMMAGDQGWKAT